MIELWLLIELEIGSVRIDIARLSHCYDVRVLSELFVGNGTVILSLLVFMIVQLDQF